MDEYTFIEDRPAMVRFQFVVAVLSVAFSMIVLMRLTGVTV